MQTCLALYQIEWTWHFAKGDHAFFAKMQSGFILGAFLFGSSEMKRNQRNTDHTVEPRYNEPRGSHEKSLLL